MHKLTLFLAFVVSAVLAYGSAAAEDYRLGPDDQLRIRAIVWNDVEREFKAWDVMTGDYTVQANGALALPISGAIPAEGRTPDELSAAVAEALQDAAGLINPPSVTVEVTAYRPFYIVGDVRRPGAYASRPGLTSLQALAIAGGVGASNNVDDPQVSTSLRNSGRLRELRNDFARANARKARLEAELVNAAEVTFPATLSHPDGALAMNNIRSEEVAIFSARNAAHKREIESLMDLADLLNLEIEGLERKAEGMTEQLRLVRENVENIATLADRGLTQTARLAEAQRGLIDLEGKDTDLQNNIFRARQSIAENKREIIELQARRKTQATIELQQVNATLEQLNVQQGVLEQVMLTEGVMVQFDGVRNVQTQYLVLRAGETAQEEIDATGRIGPGDVLTVTAVFVDNDAFTQ